MPGSPAWIATPRGRRSISQAANALSSAIDGQSRLALLVGAGVDQALSPRPSWTELLLRLGHELSRGEISSEGLSSCAAAWPTEAAEALRLTLGPEMFTAALRDALPPRQRDEVAASPLAFGITQLVRHGLSVIVSLNYTDDLVLALRANLPESMSVRVIDKVEMSAWPIGRVLEPDRGDVHILKIHGSLQLAGSSHSHEVVIDRSSYDAAVAGESPYRLMLARLFEDFAVLSLGVSWNDVPLRDAAARARRLLPVAHATHYATRRHSGCDAKDWWEERALVASYGLQPLYYGEHEHNVSIVHSIVRLAEQPSGPTPDAGLGDIADWLDGVGDYESPLQSSWFARHWRQVAHLIEGSCQSSALAPEDWLASARIERHLRHFIWTWLPVNERSDFRRSLWCKIADAWGRVANEEGQHQWQSERVSKAFDYDTASPDYQLTRAVFEFALGAYEVFGRAYSTEASASQWIERLIHLRSIAPTSIGGHRALIASEAWLKGASPDLVRMAQEARWESIEAKFVLDLAEKRFRRQVASNSLEAPRDMSARVRDSLRADLDHARDVSRVAGVSRRETPATVLASFLAPPEKAEADLVAAYRRLKDFGGEHMEHGSAWSIVFGLTAAFVDQARDFPDEDLIAPVCQYIDDKCGQVPLNRSILVAVQRNYSRYWQSFHRRAANLAPRVAAHMLASGR